MNHVLAAPQHNPATILTDHYRVTEVVHRFEADEATLVGLDNARSAITVCVRDATGLMSALALNALIKATVDFNAYANHEYGDGTLRRVEPATPRFGVYCIPIGKLTIKTRLTVMRLSRIIDRMSCEPIANFVGSVLGDPSVSMGYFTMPATALGRHVVSGSMATRAIARAENAEERAKISKRCATVGELAAAVELIRPVMVANVDRSAGEVMNRALDELRHADGELHGQLIAAIGGNGGVFRSFD